MTEGIFNTFGIGALAVGSLFFVMWLVHLPLKNAAVVDIGWGLGFILLCLVYILRGEGFTMRNTICLMLIALWGIRIVLFLLKRIIAEKEEDKRYHKMRGEFGSLAWSKFLFIFQFQAALEMLIGIPFLAVSVNPAPGISIVEIAGILIFTAALIGETVADEQLHSFKKNPQNKGKVCDVGLWRYSRHPNYFFEWMVWVGIFVFAVPSPMGWVSVISPLVMLYLLLFVSGVPLAEQQSLQSRGDAFREYQRTTSVFVPLPKRIL